MPSEVSFSAHLKYSFAWRFLALLDSAAEEEEKDSAPRSSASLAEEKSKSPPSGTPRLGLAKEAMVSRGRTQLDQGLALGTPRGV